MDRNVFWRYYIVARTAVDCDSHSPSCKLSVGRFRGAAAKGTFSDLHEHVDVLHRLSVVHISKHPLFHDAGTLKITVGCLTSTYQSIRTNPS